ncbi:MAG: patatin-like phospholipase family protein [Bacteroidetes bacterium]|nr:patatin-like phospholipase family protein [Bacteroidota bacterium]
MTAQPASKTIKLRDLFTMNFWRYFVRAIWLFFPAIIFLVIAYYCFWELPQGKDLMVISLENKYVFVYCILALVFWSYITWYSSRIVAKSRQFHHEDEHPMWTALRVQGPRLLAFTCFSIVTLAFFQLPYSDIKLSSFTCKVLLIASFPGYFIVLGIWSQLTGLAILNRERRLKFLLRLRATTYIVILVSILVVIILQWFVGLIALFIEIQIGLVLLLMVRREIIETKGDSFFQQNASERGFTTRSPALKQLKGLVSDQEDVLYFRGFAIISSIALTIYIITIVSVRFSVNIGSFPFTMLAFGVLLAVGNFITTISIAARFNFHLLFIALAVLIGHFVEPHYTKQIDKQNPLAMFSKRQRLKEFFLNWIQDSSRQEVLNDSGTQKYPVYFVLSNGGASRSGYWSALVLSKMEDETNGNFSKHLFCLSGTSGGSVGNATFFSILRSEKELQQRDTSANRCEKVADEYLKSDFLTYTLSRMLGPDIFRHLVPLSNAYDRAAALGFALEKASGKRSFLYDSMAVGFSDFMTQEGQKNYALPVICINTTRMQDGNPGVISNIDITDPIFNKRTDVLSLLDESKDLKLSTAVVLGASFPYVSPAGRIDQLEEDPKTGKQKKLPNYFVDGGYFDNSGSGVVSEMITALQQTFSHTSDSTWFNKLDFQVIHITNDEVGGSVLEEVNPMTNDLAAPIKTLLGAYSSQTKINDLRLKTYLQALYDNNDHYQRINLYKDTETMEYPMNWVISRHTLDSMQHRLFTHDKLVSLIEKMKQELR